MPAATDSPLGSYLRDRRARLDPAALGFPLARRRTPGLRREEVAQRAHVSPTWYTWLEQGRGGAPSAEVLDRIAHALMLTEVEREHIYLLALGRPPEARYPAMTEGVTPRLQRLLDALECSPALVRTSTWDVVAWNHAANVVLTDYAKIAPAQRNVLRLMFGSDRVRAAQPDWLGVARFVVAAFRADVARAGATAHAQALIDDLLRSSAEFAAIWQSHDVISHGGGTKQLIHADAGPLALEYSAFIVDGRPDLSMVVYNPATAEDRARIASLLRPAKRSRPARTV
jgi:transcriptional regulator with XRE-family HTH domain